MNLSSISKPVRWIVTSLALFASFSGATFAEEMDEEVEDGEDEVFEMSLGDILDIEVTIMKQGEGQKLIDIPLSVSSFSGKWFEENGILSVQDALNHVPGGEHYYTSDILNSASIRGVLSGAGDVPVGFYMDNVPFQPMGYQFFPPLSTFDLKNVEILRGPLGTLYGAGSQTGLIRIVTKDPTLDKAEVKVQANSYVPNDGDISYGLDFVVNQPLVENKLALRLTAGFSDYSGTLDNNLTGAENENDRQQERVRLKLLSQVNDKLSLKYTYWESNTDHGNTLYQLEDDSVLVPPGFDENGRSEVSLHDFVLEYSFANFDLFSSTNISSTLFNELVYTIQRENFVSLENDNVNSELRVKSKFEGDWQVLMGLNYAKIEQDFGIEARLRDPGTGATIPFPLNSDKETSEQLAAFTEATYTFMDKAANFTLGLRYFEDERTKSEQIQSVRDALTNAGLSPEGSASFDDVSPRMSLSWKANDKAMYYFNVGKGFKSGLIQYGTSRFLRLLYPADLTAPDALDPEVLWSYELGTKQSLLDGRMSAEVSLFHWRWKNLQTLQFFFEPGTTNFLSFVVDQVGEADNTGLEVNLRYAITDNLMWSFVGALASPRYTETVPVLGIQSGDSIANVADDSFNTSLAYTYASGENLRSRISFDIYHRTDTQLYNPTRFSQYLTTGSFNYFIEKPGDWSANLFIKNINDEDAAKNPIELDTTRINLRPLTVGVNFTKNF